MADRGLEYKPLWTYSAYFDHTAMQYIFFTKTRWSTLVHGVEGLRWKVICIYSGDGKIVDISSTQNGSPILWLLYNLSAAAHGGEKWLLTDGTLQDNNISEKSFPE